MEEKTTLEDIRYIKLVTVGSVNANQLFSAEDKEQQVSLLNKCLSAYPRGIIIGRDTSVGHYRIGEHEFITEKITYHVGFPRKPPWEEG